MLAGKALKGAVQHEGGSSLSQLHGPLQAVVRVAVLFLLQGLQRLQLGSVS